MKKIVEYGRKNFKPLAITTVLFLIYFLPYLNNIKFGMDTSNFINIPGTTLDWLRLGRQSQALISKIFFNDPQWSIFFCENMTFITFILALFSFCYLLDRLAYVAAWKTCFFFLLFMICPIWPELLYYQGQMFQTAVGVLLLPICLFLAYRPEKYCWAISILLMLILFSIYQSLVILYIAGCLLCFLLLYYDRAKQNKNTEQYFWLKLGIRQFLLFLIGFAINSIVTSKFFFRDGWYLTDPKLWGKIPAKDCLKNIAAHAARILKGESIFYTRWFTLSIFAVILLCLIFLWQRRQYKEKIWFLLALLLLQITPFLLTIYNANVSAMRTQLAYPFALACNGILLSTVLPDVLTALSWRENWKKYVLTAVYICGAFVLTRQYYDTSRVQYTTFYVWQSDERMAYRLEEKIIEETSVNGVIEKPIALIGLYTHPTNNMLAQAEVPQLTTFAQYGPKNSEFIISNSWAIPYMNALGIPVSRASDEQITAARIEAQTMSIFPSKGSIRDVGDYIVVKIGNDPWYEEDGLPPVT